MTNSNRHQGARDASYIQMTWNDFKLKFKPKPNPFNLSTYLIGIDLNELHYAKTRPSNHMWTVMQDGETKWVINGMAGRNKVNYIETENAWCGDHQVTCNGDNQP